MLAILAGYPLWLRRNAIAQSEDPEPVSWPAVTIVVTTHNEAEFIFSKLQNVYAQDYPGPWRLIVADGASTDGTVEQVQRFAATHTGCRLLHIDCAGKTSQLNAAFAECDTPWVFCTDADTRLPVDALRRMIAWGEAAADRLAVGTAIVPGDSHVLEGVHWRALNRLRAAEHACGSASIVTATGLIFRRRLLTALPTDVIADDVHIAFSALAAGGRVGFADVIGVELRSPGDLQELFLHKLRKGRALLREILRFLPRMRRMRPAARRIFLWRAAQILLAPLLFMAATVLAPAAIVLEPARAIPFLGVASVFGCLLGSPWKRPGLVSLQMLALGAFVLSVLSLGLLTYPFVLQSSIFWRVRTRTASAASPLPS